MKNSERMQIEEELYEEYQMTQPGYWVDRIVVAIFSLMTLAVIGSVVYIFGLGVKAFLLS